MLWTRMRVRSLRAVLRRSGTIAAFVGMFSLGASPGRAQITLDPGATGQISFATETITGQSASSSGPTFGTVAGYSNQLISAGHGLAVLGTPTSFGSASGSITDQTLSASLSGPSPFGSGSVSFSAGNAGMGQGVYWSSYSISGAAGASGLVSVTRANGTASFTNTGSGTLDIAAGVFFGLQGNVGAQDIAGGALATTFTIDGASYTPYVSVGFDGASSSGFVDTGFIGAAASDFVQRTSFQQDAGVMEGDGAIAYNVLLQPGQTLDMDTTFLIYKSGGSVIRDPDPFFWLTPPPVPQVPSCPWEGYYPQVSVSSAPPTNCPPAPEPTALPLGATAGVLLAGLRYRCARRTARQAHGTQRSRRSWRSRRSL